ncbi:MAG: dihydroorotase [Candidatus Kaelpia aquatica]|nr:dihydroorotase [Candidatus Kaelpia aquatica]
MKLLIKNGLVIDLEKKVFKKTDILVQGKRISKIAKNIKEKTDSAIDAKGCYVLPGLIDIHTHLREPGREDEESIESGSYAALKGGFTTLCCMPNTEPAIDSSGLVRFIRERSRDVGLVDIYPIGAITKGRAGLELSEMIKMKEAGAVGFSDDGSWVSNPLLMRRAMEYSIVSGLPLIIHAEDERLSSGGMMNEGLLSLKMGLKGIPRESEIVAIARDIELTRLTGARVHFTHISCRESVELIKRAKKDKLMVTADVTPHHLTLTEEAVGGYNTASKVNPPLRIEKDRKALINGLKNNTIDAIATDHAPHSSEEKDCNFSEASFGTIGLETALSLGLKLVDEGNIDIFSLIEKFTSNPANIVCFKDRGNILKNYLADIIIVDPDLKWKFSSEEVGSRSRNTPFLNMELKGRVRTVVSKGKVLVDDFKLIGGCL